MTREALAKLNQKQIQYCTTLSVLISRDKERDMQCLVDKESGKLKGFMDKNTAQIMIANWIFAAIVVFTAVVLSFLGIITTINQLYIMLIIAVLPMLLMLIFGIFLL